LKEKRIQTTLSGGFARLHLVESIGNFIAAIRGREYKFISAETRCGMTSNTKGILVGADEENNVLKKSTTIRSRSAADV